MNSTDPPPLAQDWMVTEQVSPRYIDLDAWPATEIIAAMYEGQLAAAASVRSALSAIAAAVDAAVPALQNGGRLVYAGAGTSGRIAVQDGTELPPTYDWPSERLVFAIAGGVGALVKSVEGAEDDRMAGERAADDAHVGPNDVVIGIAASGSTPYTIGFLERATQKDAVTIAVANNPGAPLLVAARYPILVETGVEVIAGSTRMKAGTAQKIVLNLFSTAVMVRLGRVYQGLMVHMQARNAKLRRRAEAMVRGIVRCSHAEATNYVNLANGDVKIAVLLAFGLCELEARHLLGVHSGNLRSVIDAISHLRG